jgi:Holliday junction resolvase RusA-like endonuclease
MILPIPPTTNHMYGFSGHMKYKTAQMKAWEVEAGWEVKKQWKRETIDVPVYCGIVIYYDRNRDVDNLKAIPDLLQDCGVITNDMLIEHMNIKKFQDKKNPRVEVEIEVLK